MSQPKTGEALSPKALRAEIERLEGLNLPQLRKRFKEVFGKAADPSSTALVLRRRIAQRLQTKAHGKVEAVKESEAEATETLAPSVPQEVPLEAVVGMGPGEEEVSEPAQVEAEDAPVGAVEAGEMPAESATPLPSRWIALGESSERLYLTEALIERLGFVQGKDGHWVPGKTRKRGRPAEEGGRDPRLPVPGTILARTFKGIRYEVEVQEKGFSCQGHPYRSLSALASELTGYPTSGFVFFGLAGQP